ncbi:MAG: hypothetical protein JRF36_17415 [Deltaproteobacteria bacterium]|jgi:hypothetical protein|nr:hypothetical protein [Deltaproteobacteria bacterium]
MNILSSLLVGKPLNIMAFATVPVVCHFLLRLTGVGSDRHPRALLVVAATWALYAAWEWLVQIKTPEANIRVDLMVIWPIVLSISVWFSIRAFK